MILKIIGIVLLSILLLLLSVLLLVLFVPVRYKLTAEYKDSSGFFGLLKISWLLHFINSKVQYSDDLYYLFRILIFPVKKSDNLKNKRVGENKEEAQIANKESTENSEYVENTEADSAKNSQNDSELAGRVSEGTASFTTGESESADTKTCECEITVPKDYIESELIEDDFLEFEESYTDADSSYEKLISDNNISSKTIEDNESNENNKDTEYRKGIKDFAKFIFSIIEHIFDFIINLDERIGALISEVINKLSNLEAFIEEKVDTIEYYFELFSDEKNKETIALCLGRVHKILKHVNPKKIKGKARFGFEDPSLTGQILSIYSILYPFLHDKIQVVPEFDEEILEGDIHISGRIRIIVLLIAAARLYFGKDVRKLIKDLKRE